VVTFSTAFTVIGLILSAAACLFAARAAARAQELQDRLTVLPWSQLQSLASSLTDTQETLTELANRVKMMRVRNAVRHTDDSKNGEPDARLDPERWRIWKNAQLRAGEFNT